MKAKITVKSYGLTIKKSEAIVVAKTLQEIEKESGVVTPTMVLDHAREAASPLHHLFEWRDSEAAEQFRLIQARRLIQSVQVQFTDDGGKSSQVMRAFVNVTPSDEDEEENPAVQRGYISLNRVAKNKYYAEQVVQAAYSFLLSWQRRYATLKEFLPVTEAIQEVTKKLKVKKK